MEKIVFIDHSYHQKTKSNFFLIDLLREKYEVEIIYENTWRGEKEPDLSHINSSYKAVIFFQNISKRMLNLVNHNNIIFFPMYDACCDVTLDYWFDIKDVKIVNFSKTIHDKLVTLGFKSMYIKYFPVPLTFTATPEKSIFFWHRRWEITWDTVRTLFPAKDINHVHIHKAVDPEQKFISPSPSDEKNYAISYSDWFDTREEYFKVLTDKSIYIAPRITEGIGFSFLEAMAMGKVVVAADNPTMNEYITHGVNGFLFDYKAPQQLTITDFLAIQKNAYETVVNGRAEWEKNKYSIMSFIEETPKKNLNFRFKMRGSIVASKTKKIVKKTIKYCLPYGIVTKYQNRKR